MILTSEPNAVLWLRFGGVSPVGYFLAEASHTHPPKKSSPLNEHPIQRDAQQFGGSAFASQDCLIVKQRPACISTVKAGKIRATAGMMPESSYVPVNERNKPYLTVEERNPDTGTHSLSLRRKDVCLCLK